MRSSDGAAQPIFILEEVSKTYPGTRALSSVSLTIHAGERVALVGPSGSGKTTLLQLLAAWLLPDEGEVRIDGVPSARLKPGRRLARLVGVMPQQFDLVDALPVVHNVLAGRLGEWGLLKSALSLIVPQEVDRAKAALARVGIAEKLWERTSHLSGGEQQRVALARLLLQRPRAILADEPVSSLDPARAEDLIAMLTGLAAEEGQTLVASLHSVPLALQYFDRIVALRRGRILFDRPAGRVTPEDLAKVYQLDESSEAGVEVAKGKVAAVEERDAGTATDRRIRAPRRQAQA